MEEYIIKIGKDGEITEYIVIPFITDEIDNHFGVFHRGVFICRIWSEYDINGVIWRAGNDQLRQEVVDEIGTGIEARDL